MGSRLAGFHDFAPPDESFREAMLAGLAERPKRLPSKFIYDERGSRLFDVILTAEEYYIPRVETGILKARGAEIAALAGPAAYVIDYGSGAMTKTRAFLDALDRPAAYVPIDISRDHLRQAAETLAGEYPDLEVHAVCADYLRPFDLPAARRPAGRRIGFFPGSTIGNMTPEERHLFLRTARTRLAGGGLFVGVDLKKDPAVLQGAYNDSRGASAAFNTNILARANRELGADFDMAAFRHRAVYEAEFGRMAIGIESLKAQTMRLGARAFDFASGEIVHTQHAYKFTVEEFAAIAAAAGFTPVRSWTDPGDMFAVCYLAA